MYKNKKLQQIAFYSGEKIHASEITKDHFVSVDNLNQNKQGISSTDFNPKGNLIFYKKGDTLVGNIRPYLKKIWYASNDGGCSPDVLVIRPKNNIDSKYLFYSLFRDDFFVHMMNGAKGTKMPRGDKNQILQFQVPNFSLNEQNKIASVLSSLDDKIELNNRINADLEQMAKTIYDYWFVQFDFPISTEYAAAVGKPELAGKPYKSSGGKMVWSDELKRDVPEGWEVKKLREIVTIIKDTLQPESINSETVYIGLEHIPRKSITLCNWENVSKIDSAKFKFAKNDILFGKIRPYFHKVGICLMSGITSIDCLIMRSNDPNYLGLVLQNVFSYEFVDLATNSSTGSKMPRADWNILKNYCLVAPPINLLEKYNDLSNSIISKIGNIVFENQELISLRDWLLPMLMNGQVSVGDGENVGVMGMAAEGREEYGSKKVNF